VLSLLYSSIHHRPALLGLEHATIRDNIIFGCAYGFNQARYQAVLDACALTKDLEILDAGDMTGTCVSIDYPILFLSLYRNW
jgi:hypothetical protein